MPAGAAIGFITSLTGMAFARDENGNMRSLRSGDTVHEGETLITVRGARVELVFMDESSLLIGEDRTISLTPELTLEAAPDAAESSLSRSTLDDLLRGLADGQDPSDKIHVPAAGTGNSGASDAQGFVHVLRIAEGTKTAVLRFDSTNP